MSVDFEALARAAPDIIVIVERDGRVVFANDAIERVAASARSLIGTTLDAFLDATSASALRCVIADVLLQQSARTLDLAFATRQRFMATVTPFAGDRVCVFARDVETSRVRERKLQALAEKLSRALTQQEIVEIVLQDARDALDAGPTGAGLVDGDALRIVGMRGVNDPRIVATYRRVPLGSRSPTADAVRTGEIVWCATQAEVMARYPDHEALWRQQNVHALGAFPFAFGVATLGALSVSFTEPRVLTDDDRELMRAMGQLTAQALERARLSDEHTRSAEQLRHALRAARAATWSIDLATMRVTRDESYRALVGSFENESALDFIPAHPDDREPTRELFERALRDRTPFEPVLRLRRADGSYIWIQAHGRLTYDTDGKPVTMSGVFVDIDEQRQISLRAAEERRISETLDRLAASLASELDHDRLVQRMTVELTKLIGAEHGSFYPHPVVVERGRGGSHLEVPIVSASGEPHGILVFHHREHDRFSDQHQRLVSSIASQAAVALENARLYRSLREHKEQLERAIERARVADRRKDEFLAMLGHEMRNPLAPILTALELMDMKEVDVVRKEREIIRRQVTHLSRLIDDLLDVSRITRGKIQLARETLELSTIISKAIEMASPLLDRRRQHLDVDVPAEGALVEADPVRLAQVFHNLLTNAAKYSDPGSRITVRATASDTELAVSVRDEGIGISSDLLPRLFDMFVQGERALDRAEGGLGIGLTIARSLCELHDGRISAASDGPGTGTTFTVTLPRSTRPRVSTDAMKPLRIPQPHLPGARVLVVDDNIDAAVMLREMLVAAGHELEIAHDGPSALEVAAAFKPQIAVLDIGLPVMSGYELARKLREQHGPSGLRLIAVTGYGQETDRARAKEVGFEDHLVKPIALDALLALLTR